MLRLPVPSINVGQTAPLSRSNTQTSTAPSQEVKELYKTGLFMDPPAKRAYFRGPNIVTEAHARLTELLRGECALLNTSNKNLHKRLSTLSERLIRRDEMITNLREDLAARNTALNVVTEELDAANESLREMDEMVKRSRAEMDDVLTKERDKRRNRNSVLSQMHGIQLGDPVN